MASISSLNLSNALAARRSWLQLPAKVHLPVFYAVCARPNSSSKNEPVSCRIRRKQISKLTECRDWSGRSNLSSKCCSVLQNDVPLIPQEKRNLVEKIRERISNGKVEMSPSAYDTAWVAMVPSRDNYSSRPSFPECLDWIMENQNPDGSWGPDPGHHPFLLKDSLSCTLACLLALHKWNVANQLVQRGMDFIESNCWAAHDDQLLSPIGFDIIFPAMINYANQLELNIPLPPTLLHSLLHIRDSKIREGKWEYVAEGVTENSSKWKQIIESHQRRNGSLFNSPATTAAAVIHSHDNKCFDYLISTLQNNKGCVPTMSPVDIYARLCMIDTLQRLGIDRYFGVELTTIFDEIYRNWQERDEEIFSDVACQALAFRLLRRKGYDVSSDELAEFVEEEGFFNMVSMQHGGADTVLELYRASLTRINEDETTLDKINAWTKPFLKHHLLNQTLRDKRLEKQVEYDLKNFYGTLYRFQNRRTIDLYDAQSFQFAKTAYRCSAVDNQDLFNFAIQDFETSRAEYLKELEQINKWYCDCRLDLLNQRRNVCREAYISIAAVIIDPHLSMARITMAHAMLLVTLLDDFFDCFGSKQEAFAIIHLIKEWKPADSYCSREVEILFTTLYNTVNEIAAKAYAEHGFCAKQQLIDLWIELLDSAVREKESLSGNSVATLEEYLSFAPDTIGCKTCVMTSIHFLGIKLSEEMLASEELSSLCKHGSLVCRLLNDLKSYEKEREENKVNCVSVQTMGGGVTEEEAVAKVEELLEYHRRKVMQMIVCGRERSIVPRECRELVWKSCMLAHCLYGGDGGGDEFSSPQDILNDINAMMFEPFPGC